ncbi:hypothetical protein V6R21_11240 [Limibacter armeniacum]|uniref:DUF6909 family protein n=1 Tax=Limibacter armeniacum TaxID=466084 RepID=UPI002FE50757
MEQQIHLTRAQESRAAIERLYVAMRHLFIRGYYKPSGASGRALIEELLALRPEIYGSINDPRKVELDGLVYVIDRLPKGIEACRFIKLVSEEGYENSGFKKIIPAARRRNCYRIDQEQMFIEVTRGRSEIYDILTHLTFLFVEAEKIKNHSLDEKGEPLREWLRLEEIVTGEVAFTKQNEEIIFTYLSTILGRTYEETRAAHQRFQKNDDKNSGLFNIVYWLGKLAIDEEQEGLARHISFSPALRSRIGHHIYGERWANRIKHYLFKNNMIERPLHIISANLHSVMNMLYGKPALGKEFAKMDLLEVVEQISDAKNRHLSETVNVFAEDFGMHTLRESSGTNIAVQVVDTDKIDFTKLDESSSYDLAYIKEQRPVLLVMDYAFGEQAFEAMDELLKPYSENGGQDIKLNVKSVSVMGKAGILYGGKGDIMIPSSHVFEGTADNYPIDNDFSVKDFKKQKELEVYEGSMITVLGTSLQNKDILEYFKSSSWNAVGLEMEGAHYQKAIQGAMAVRNNISRDVKIRYAYYASDNPLITGSTLASGSLGLTGVKPTYLITQKILEKIFNK